MKAKRKGNRNEHRSIRLLETVGYACTRAAASLGAFDIIGIGSADVVLCQVKTRDWPGTEERDGNHSGLSLSAELPEIASSLAGQDEVA